MGARDNESRIQILERRLAQIENTVRALPSVAADPGKVHSVFATYAGALNDTVKLDAGTWSACIDTDTVTGPVGVVVAISSTWAEIVILGTRVADGTPGDTYYAPTVAGEPVTTEGKIPVERQITPTLRLVGNVSVAGGNVAVTLAVFGGAVGDVLKCVAGTWSYLTDADAGAFLVGFITDVGEDPFDATVLVYGVGAVSGTQGTVYYAPPADGAMTATRPTPAIPPTVSPWERVVAVQITAELRQLLQVPAFRLLAIPDCEASPVTHYLPETTV